MSPQRQTTLGLILVVLIIVLFTLARVWKSVHWHF